MAAVSSILSGIGLAMAAAGGVSSYKQQRKAQKLAQEKMRQDQINFETAMQNQKEAANRQLAEAQRVHGDNMAHLRNTLAADQQRFGQQFAQAERGLQMQQKAMDEQRAQSERALNNQKAQMERQINADNAAQDIQRHKKEDEGVAGTLLTGPGGIDKDKLKLGKKTLLGQ